MGNDDLDFEDLEAMKGFEEAMAEMEKHRYDSMSKIALVRTVVVKHNPSESTWNKRTITIEHSQIFELGLTNVGDRYAHNWINDEWETHGDGCVEYLLKDKPNGIYEIVGDLYYHGWESGYEEREYESECDVRDFKIQALTFEQACRFAGDKFQEDEVDLVKLVDKDSGFMDWDTQIHHYMSKMDILRAHAKALCSVMQEFWSGGSTDVKGMDEDQLEMFIQMCMLEIDSKSESNKPKDNMVFILASKMDETVRKTIEASEALFK